MLQWQSTERVLILEYMDGVRLNDLVSLENLGVDKQKLVEEITRAYAHQIYVGGIFNGDPHPGTVYTPFLYLQLNFSVYFSSGTKFFMFCFRCASDYWKL